MNRAIPRTALAAALIAFIAFPAAAIEVGLRLGGGNLQFPWSPIKPFEGSVFPATNFWLGGEAWFVAPMGEDATFKLGYERDPVLRNSLLGAIQFERGIAKVSVGPMIGFLNTSSVPVSAGLSSSVRLQWPGVAYISMRSDGGPAVSISQSGADPQARTEFAAGVYVPHAIVSGLVSAKRFNEIDAEGDLVTDMATRYALTIDVFKKNVPYTALASIGYEVRSKRFAGSELIDSLGAVIIGFESSAQITQAIKMEAAINSGLYVFGLDEMKNRGPANSSFIFDASLGISLDLDLLPAREEKTVDEVAVTVADEIAAEGETQGLIPSAVLGSEGSANDILPVEPSAEEPAALPPSRLGFETAAFCSYNVASLPLGAVGILAALFNIRGGAWFGLEYALSPAFLVGGEIGASYMSATFDDTTLHLIDAPLRATAAWKLGSFKAKAFAGMLASASIGSSDSPEIGFYAEAGGRIALGGVFVEGSYALGLSRSSFPRFGAGYALKLK